MKHLKIFAQITANKFFSDYYTSCEFVIGELCAYADRELPQKDYLKINEHLAHCECCKNEFESLKLTSQAVSGYLKKDILKYNNDLSIKFIINKVEQAKNRKNLAVSISAIAMLAVVGWLSFDVANINVSFNPDNKKEISYQNPLDKSENFLFKTAYLVPEDGVITVFYENE
ncbi:MAG: zf-HC2 domain-containing protein [Candidatus Moduliflexus flocculans]|nr:zf-HC2 domain-containing protein [Candidatus Moduliflexus flocculans]